MPDIHQKQRCYTTDWSGNYDVMSEYDVIVMNDLANL